MDQSSDLENIAGGPASALAPTLPETSKTYHPYPFYSPRFWHGMTPLTWYKLLRSGGFRVSPKRWIHASVTTAASPMNAVLSLVQKLVFRRRLADAQLFGPPVFIIGHWRSGTTLLHELMVHDERLSSPSTFQCFEPHHFLLTEKLFQRFGRWMLPQKRPMDNMAAGWERPMEDEFALLSLGLPSPYRRIAFPNCGAVDMNYLDFDGVPQDQIDVWFAHLRRFLLAVSTATGRPLVIKSPTHTGRIAHLAQAFPEARFIHMTRNPLEIVPSTCRLWKSLDHSQSLNVSGSADYETYVHACYRRMYAAFQRDRQSFPPHRLIDVRYDQLTERPVETLQQIYETLHLSDFEPVKPSVQKWAETEHKQYQPNRHQRRPEQDATIRGIWHDYFQSYGYQ